MTNNFYELYVFDAYGTLFDVHSAVGKYAKELGKEGAEMSNLWRIKQLEYSWVRGGMGNAYVDFWQLTQQALNYALDKYPQISRSYQNKLLDAYMELSCYEEVKEVLSDIKAANGQVAILSNGSPMMLNAAIEANQIGSYIDEVLSVDSIADFKPSKAVYAMLNEHFHVLLNKVTFQSCNRWDIAAASKFGFDTSWINRYGEPDEYADCPPKRILQDLTTVPNLRP